jgi:hypothetical protein
MAKKKDDDKFPKLGFDNHDFFDNNGEIVNVYDLKGHKKGSKKTSHYSSYSSCWKKHPILKVLNGTIQGGSCSDTDGIEADIFIGHADWMPKVKHYYPWNPPDANEGALRIHMPMPDRSSPPEPKEHIKMVDWVIEQLKLGKRIHIGCMGGHGRTGTTIAAIIAKATGNVDAITWVRENYCKKAVESKVQVAYLVNSFGVKSIAATDKEYTGATYSNDKWKDNFKTYNEYASTRGDAEFEASPVASPAAIW